MTDLEKQLRDALVSVAYHYTEIPIPQKGLVRAMLCRKCARYDGGHAPDCEIGAALDAAKHIHVAGTTVGLDIDTCADCGHDIRHEIHAGMRP